MTHSAFGIRALGLLIDSRKIDNRDPMLGSDEVSVNAGEHLYHIVMGPEFRVFALDVSWRELGYGFHLNPVEDCRVQLLAAAETGADRYPNHHSRSIFFGLIA